MKSSFQQGRSAAAAMAGRAIFPKNKVSKGTQSPPFTRENAGPESPTKDAMKGNPRALGMVLQVYRGARTKASVARAAGFSRNKLGAYERGTIVPRQATLKKIAAALDVTVPAIEALANLLSLTPGLLEGRAEPEGMRALERAARLAARLSSVGPPVVPAALGRETGQAEGELKAAALWLRLLPYSAAQRRAVVQENEEFHLWPLSRLLCEEAAAQDPAEALELARLAELIASLAPVRR